MASGLSIRTSWSCRSCGPRLSGASSCAVRSGVSSRSRAASWTVGSCWTRLSSRALDAAAHHLLRHDDHRTRSGTSVSSSLAVFSGYSRLSRWSGWSARAGGARRRTVACTATVGTAGTAGHTGYASFWARIGQSGFDPRLRTCLDTIRRRLVVTTRSGQGDRERMAIAAGRSHHLLPGVVGVALKLAHVSDNHVVEAVDVGQNRDGHTQCGHDRHRRTSTRGCQKCALHTHPAID